MVKGNWERRAELASQRKADGKLKKEMKKETPSGERNKQESVYNKLIKDEALQEKDATDAYPLIWVWLQSEEETTVCSEWFRNESCYAGKKCKIPHPSVTVAHLLFNAEAPPYEIKDVQCDEPVPFRSIIRRNVNRICFIAVAKECIFDSGNPSIWQTWYAKRAPSIDLKGLGTIDEGEELVEGVDKVTEEAEKMIALLTIDCKSSDSDISSQKSILLSLVSAPDKRLVVHMLSYLSNNDMLRFLHLSKALRLQCLSEEFAHDNSGRILHLRYKEALSVNMSKMKEVMSKMKREEKKKKSKQAHISGKQGKKDGFARGGAS